MNAFIQASSIANPTGLWLIHGEEPLVASWLLDNWRTTWNKNQVERKRFDTKSKKVWDDALAEFQAMGLFSSQTVVEIHGNYKPDKNALNKLKSFCENPDENCLIVMMPTQDWKDKKTVFYKTCEQYGNVFETTLKNQQDRTNLLKIKAQEFLLELDSQAWSVLLENTQNNLLAAFQALWRMSDLAVINHNADFANNQSITVTADMLIPALVSQSKFTTFDLIAQIKLGNLTKVIEIINYLKESSEQPSALLWQLAKEVRTISQLIAGVTVRMQSWQLREYQAIIKRTNAKTCAQWSQTLLAIDKSIKGLNHIPVWEQMLTLCVSMTGKQILS